MPQQNQRKNLAEKARQEIERLILAGGLRPDQHLIETELADQLGVSRTPLREALRQLEVKGLLKKRKSVGYTVIYHSPEDMRNTFEVRLSLESTAVRLACERATASQIDQAYFYLTRFDEDLAEWGKGKKKGSALAFNFLDAEHDWNSLFHKEIYQASGNALLTRFIMNIRDLERLKRITLQFTLEDFQIFQSQHYAILQAIKERDKGKAVRAIQSHIQRVYDFYYRFS